VYIEWRIRYGTDLAKLRAPIKAVEILPYYLRSKSFAIVMQHYSERTGIYYTN
jgi:hypothetical protein